MNGGCCVRVFFLNGFNARTPMGGAGLRVERERAELFCIGRARETVLVLCRWRGGWRGGVAFCGVRV